MKTVIKTAVVHGEKCIGCGICVKVCPVVAIHMEQAGDRKKAMVDANICQGCNICVSRCPEAALALENAPEAREVGMEKIEVNKAIEEICKAAHMYPDQVVCFCHRVQAKEIAAAILAGAETPEDVARMTGARAGCGVLCITGIIRLLNGAGIKLEKAAGNQWYGKIMTVWDLPENVIEKYGEQYYLREDQKYMSNLYPGGDQ